MKKQDLKTALWIDQIKSISKFYKEEFNIIINWSCVKLPEWTPERPRLDYRHLLLSGKTMLENYSKKFKDLDDNDLTINPDNYIYEQQECPKENYAFAWSGDLEPDTEHLDKHYLMFNADGNDYFVPLEGIIAAYRLRWETGEILDQKGSTFFNALDNDYDCMFMNHELFQSNDQSLFMINSTDYNTYHERNSGPRQKVLFKK